MVLETRAIREAISDAAIFSVDPIFDGVDPSLHLPEETDTDPKQRDLRMAASSYPASLVCGKVQPGDAFAEFLTKHSVAEADIAWVQQRVSKPDVLGCNNYPDIFQKGGDFMRKGNIPLEQAARQAADDTEQGIRNSYAYFQMPIYLTETSAGLTTETKVAYKKQIRGWTAKAAHPRRLS